jgi:HEAT repeat protein
VLVELATAGDIERRRAALEALGNLRDASLEGRLVEELEAGDDGVAATAAWALAKLGRPSALPPLVRAIKRDAFAVPINASAAVALIAGAGDREVILTLLRHRSRWVRTNAAWAAGRLQIAAAGKPLVELLGHDPSWVVRVAAARALSRLGAGKTALTRAAERDGRSEVKAAASAALARRFAPPARGEWRNLYFVDPTSGDARVKMEPYVIIGSDGLVTALYSDARGEAAEEWAPPGDTLKIPRGQEREY